MAGGRTPSSRPFVARYSESSMLGPPARLKSLSVEERRNVIPSHLFVTRKYDAQGNIVREKGRWVAGGNFLDMAAMDMQCLPTMNQSSPMILLSIAATSRYEVLTFDIKGAYLYTTSKEDEPQIYIWIDKAVAEILCEVSPEYRQHRWDDGRILVQLKRYLYSFTGSISISQISF
jgi:hypothetical protein